MISQHQRFWFAASWRRALYETLLIAVGLWLILGLSLNTLPHHAWTWPPGNATISAVNANYTVNISLIVNMLSIVWFVLRHQPAPRLWSKQGLHHIIGSMVVVIFLLCLFGIALPIISHTPGYYGSHFNILDPLQGTLTCMLISSGTRRILQWWNKLRKRSLIWSLPHMYVMGIGVVLCLYLLLIGIAEWGTANPLLLNQENFFSLGFFLFIGIALIMLIPVLPFLILLSALALHKTVKRIKTLTRVTTEMRQGRYSLRVPIEGQDEVAHLQENFNAMAQSLEQTIGELQQERDRVAYLLQERRDLFATVSHELRTPITILRGYLETAWNDQLQTYSPTLRESLTVMQHEVLHLQERTDELFLLSQADAQPVSVQTSPCDIRPLVEAIVTRSAPLARRIEKVEVVADIPEEVPAIKADIQRLEQALTNLLHNALRHTPPGGVIAVIVQVQSQRVTISVEDTGEGIAPEELDQIWTRFYQSQHTHARGGAGLGLVMVKEWIEAMGGMVAVSSILGEGSCFTIDIPRMHAEYTSTEAKKR